MAIQIHWQEGLFLQPHHLQRMQKGFSDQVAQERRLGWAYPYGLIEARLSRDELENFRVRFDKLRLIMPSGLELNYPENTELPSLDVKQAFARGAGTFGIFIGVPLWQNARANTLNGSGGDSRVKLIYRIAEMECADENTGENPKPIQVRKINARLMFDNEDASDMELLPLLRIVRATGEEVGLPKEDPEFVPPCFVLTGSPVLRELVRDLVSQVEASRKELVVQITRGGFSLENMRGLQIEQMLRLRTLNRFSGRLPALVLATGVTPFVMYLELRELLGELAALHPDRDEFEAAAYNHDNPYLAFRDLSNKIRSLLRGAVAPSFTKVQFKEANGVLTAQLTEDQIAQPNAYFLGVKTKAEPMALGRFIETPDRADTPDKFKLMPTSLITRAVRGIVLKEERHPPLELPASADLHYFRLDRAASARMWEQVKAEKSASIRWTGNEVDFSDATFTLYMTTPATLTKS
ncbi:MAG TPA: type VI secretion system baseplate subunit TssK [Candidatus Binatia bacterium]|nr:type VI secretion system baseplate subunit TssK [Candidatus Binatia bacterium]